MVWSNYFWTLNHLYFISGWVEESACFKMRKGEERYCDDLAASLRPYPLSLEVAVMIDFKARKISHRNWPVITSLWFVTHFQAVSLLGSQFSGHFTNQQLCSPLSLARASETHCASWRTRDSYSTFSQGHHTSLHTQTLAYSYYHFWGPHWIFDGHRAQGFFSLSYEENHHIHF